MSDKTLTTPRTKIGTIFDRNNFNKLPGGINWRRNEEAKKIALLPTVEFLKKIKEDAQHGQA